MKKIVLYVVAGVIGLLVVVGVGGGTAYLVLSRIGVPTAPASGLSGTPSTELAAEGTVLKLEPFVTNLADADRPRYINVTFELVARNEKSVEALQGHIPDIRDAVVGILNTKTSLEVTGTEGANKLKSDIMKALNERLRDSHVQNVLITDFVVQF